MALSSSFNESMELDITSEDDDDVVDIFIARRGSGCDMNINLCCCMNDVNEVIDVVPCILK